MKIMETYQKSFIDNNNNNQNQNISATNNMMTFNQVGFNLTNNFNSNSLIGLTNVNSSRLNDGTLDNNPHQQQPLSLVIGNSRSARS